MTFVAIYHLSFRTFRLRLTTLSLLTFANKPMAQLAAKISFHHAKKFTMKS